MPPEESAAAVPPAPEAPAPPAPAPPPDDEGMDLDAVLKEGMGESGAWSLGGAAEDEPPPAEEPAEDEPEDTGAQPIGEPVEEPPADDEPKQKRWTFSQVRKERKRAERALAEAQQREARLAQQEAELQQQQQRMQALRELAKRDPGKALSVFAESTGLNVDEVYQLETHRRLGLGPDGVVDEKTAANSELQRVLKEVEDLKRQVAEREQRQRQEAEQALFQRDTYQVATRVHAKDENGKHKYPYLLIQREDKLNNAIATAVDVIRRNRAKLPKDLYAEDVCNALNEEFKKDHEHQLERRKAVFGVEASVPAGASSVKGTPSQAEEKPAGDQRRRSGRKAGTGVSNNASAATSAGARALSAEEQLEELDKLLKESMIDSD